MYKIFWASFHFCSGVERLTNQNLEKLFDSMKNDVAKLMGIVAPTCKRMTLLCRSIKESFHFFLHILNEPI